MSSFTISFTFRGQSYVASIYQSGAQPNLYSVYFTDVELIFEFGSKVEYTHDGKLQLSKKADQQIISLLTQALTEPIKNAA